MLVGIGRTVYRARLMAPGEGSMERSHAAAGQYPTRTPKGESTPAFTIHRTDQNGPVGYPVTVRRRSCAAVNTRTAPIAAIAATSETKVNRIELLV